MERICHIRWSSRISKQRACVHAPLLLARDLVIRHELLDILLHGLAAGCDIVDDGGRPLRLQHE